jgi:PKD repeat protein
MEIRATKTAIDACYINNSMQQQFNVYVKKFTFSAKVCAIVLVWFFSATFSLHAQTTCNSDVPRFIIDLTASAEAQWATSGPLKPSGQCCGAAHNQNCIEFEVYVHPEANGLQMAFTTAQGSLYYTVNCGPWQHVSAKGTGMNVVDLCFDHADTGPYFITFCRNGSPTYEFIFSGLVNVQPVSLDPFAPVCINAPGFLLTGGQPTGGVYYVNGSATPFFDPAIAGAGDHEILYQYTSPAGCVGFATQTISVKPLPVLNISSEAFCKNSGILPLTGASPTGGVYTGSFISNNNFNTNQALPGNYPINYTYIDEFGCSSAISSNVIVNPLPLADAGPDQIIEEGYSTTLAAASGGSGNYAYSWSPAHLLVDPNVRFPETVELTESTIFTVLVTDLLTGCQSTDQMIVMITGGLLSIPYMQAYPSTICDGDTTFISVIPSGGSGTFNYLWTADPPMAGFPSTQSSHYITPSVTTIFTVVVSDADPDYNVTPVQSSITITVNPLPEVALNLPENRVCANTPGYALTGGYPEGGTYYVINEHGNILSLPYINLSNFLPHDIGAGNYTIMYEYINPVTGCFDAAFQPFTILPYVKADFHVYKPDVCDPTELTILNYSAVAGNTYLWQFGDGTTGNNSSPTFQHRASSIPFNNIYPITLTAVNGECISTVQRSVKIPDPIITQATVSLTEGCSPLEVEFTSLSEGPFRFNLWEFGDGTFSFDPHPRKTFENNSATDTTFRVILYNLSSDYFCITTDTIDITVYPAITAGFTVQPAFGCQPLEVTLGDFSKGAHSWLWDFGNGIVSSDANPGSHIFYNITDSVVTYILTQIVANANCSDTIQQTVTVYPQILALFEASATEGCSPLEVNFSNLSSEVATGFEWTFGDGASTSEISPTHIFENNTTESITYRVYLKARYDGEHLCSDSVGMDIIVHPYLQAGFHFGPSEICNDQEVTLVNDSYGATIFHWSMGNGTEYTWNEPQTALVHTFSHNSSEPVVQTVQLRVLNPQGCADTLERNITIFPRVTASFSPSLTEGCTDLEVEFVNNSTNALSFRWEFGDQGSSAVNSPVHIFINESYTADKQFEVRLFAQSEYLCRDSVNTTITVFPKVEAEFTVFNNQGCSPFMVELDNHSMGAATLSWNFGNGNSEVSDDPVVFQMFTNHNADIQYYQVELTAVNSRGCTDSRQRTITVFPEVNPAYNHITEGCHPLEVKFDNATTHGHYYAWNFGGGMSSSVASPAHSFTNFSHINTQVYDVNLMATSIYGCFATASSQVTVFPKPDASFDVVNSPGCSPHELEIANNSMGATTLVWDFGDGSGTFNSADATVKHLYNLEPGSGTGYYNINLLVTNGFGCSDTLSRGVIIYPNITATFTASELEGCHPFTVDLTNLSYGATAAGSYLWDYGDGKISQNSLQLHNHVFNNFNHTRDTIYTVTLTAFNENNCQHTHSVDIRVWPRPKALFSVPNNQGCSPHDVIIDNHSSGALQYTWDMGDGETLNVTDNQFTHLYRQPADLGPGLFILNLRVENEFNCDDTHAQQIIIYPDVEPYFETIDEGCHPLVALFENLSQGGDLYTWNFDNGITSHAANPQQVFVNYSHTESKTFHVNLHVQSTWGCSATYTHPVTVRPVPFAAFNVSPNVGCSPHTSTITNLSVGANGFNWYLGNGLSDNAEPAFEHSWENKGTATQLFPVMLGIWNEYGCQAFNNSVITVYPEVTASFTTVDDVWEGCSPLTVKFNNTSKLAEYYRWDFTDGRKTTSASPLHAFQNHDIHNRIFPVEMIATSIHGCRDTIVREVTVFPSPKAFFTPDPRKQVYPNTTVNFTNQTNPGIWNFTWEYGDGNNLQTTSAATISHSYIWDENDMSTKDYVVALRAQNEHCSDLHTQVITITSPIPKAEVSSVTSGCAPFTVDFSNHSDYAHSYRWFFGDGGASTHPTPVHTFLDPGIFDVLMVAIGDGGRDSIYHRVHVIENPTADFKLVVPHVNIPDEPLRLVNLSKLSDTYMWDFGDGNTSFEFEPEHFYSEPGIYDISLMVVRHSQPLCYDTLMLKNAIRVEQSCKLIFPDAFMPSTSGPNGGAYDRFVPSTTVFHPVHDGIDDYALEIYTRWGELLFRSNDVNIGWDGYVRGKLAKMDVYVWKVTGRCANGRSIINSGDVTLYR